MESNFPKIYKGGGAPAGSTFVYIQFNSSKQNEY